MRLQPQPVVNEFFAYEKNNILKISQHKQRKIKKKGEVHVPRVLYFNVTKPPLCIYLIPFFVKFLSHFF